MLRSAEALRFAAPSIRRVTKYASSCFHGNSEHLSTSRRMKLFVVPFANAAAQPRLALMVRCFTEDAGFRNRKTAQATSLALPRVTDFKKLTLQAGRGASVLLLQ